MKMSTLVILVVGFFAGVAIRTSYAVPLEVLLFCLLLSLGLGLVWRRKNFVFSAPLIFLASLFLFTLSVGIVRTEIASWQFGVSDLASSLNESITIEGIVSQEPDYREKTVHLYVETEEDLILVTADRLQPFAYGDRVQVEGKLEQPSTFETELGRSFNYATYLQAKGVEYRISFAEVSIIQTGQGNVIIENLLKAKQILIKGMQQVIPEPAVGLAGGLLLGVKSGLGDDIETDFRRTGIIHIVVLSGYNVMLVVAFILYFFSFLMPPRPRMIAGLIAITAFALIVGLSATVVRASIMASLVLLAGAYGRHYDVFRSLLLAGFLMVLINPYLLLYDIGFQLSFMATVGLVLFTPQFEAALIERSDWLGVRPFFVATVSTQIAVLPLLVYHIGEISIIAIIINLLVLPVVPFAMLLSFIAGTLTLVAMPIASLVGFLAYLTLSYILKIAAWGAALPIAVVEMPVISVPTMLLAYILMIGLWYWWTHLRTEDELSGWLIEEEPETTDIKSTASEDTPVFFR